MSQSRKPARRPSFVVIVTASAAAAIASGCGASVVPCPDAGGDGGRCEMPDNECPTSAPMQGSACFVAETAQCEYERNQACGNSPGRTARCVASSHTWQVSQSSCNPPPPTCPALAPANGDSCSPGWGPSPNCQYSPCGDQFSVHATCDASARQWRVTAASCNPPAPVCPALAPATGAACTLSQAPLNCRYGECVDGSLVQSNCDSQTLTWRTVAFECLPPSDGGGPVDAGDADGSVDDDASSDGGSVEPTDAGSGGGGAVDARAH